MTAMPVMIGVLCAMAIAYRYYSAFLAAKVAVLDDARVTPAVRLNDGQNYHPTNKWVLFGHHFAAISGAGPLIGPVLAAQVGYLPGLLSIVIPQAAQWSGGEVAGRWIYNIPAESKLVWNNGQSSMEFTGPFQLASKQAINSSNGVLALPADAVRLVPGSAWGTFTIACTIP